MALYRSPKHPPAVPALHSYSPSICSARWPFRKIYDDGTDAFSERKKEGGREKKKFAGGQVRSSVGSFLVFVHALEFMSLPETL